MDSFICGSCTAVFHDIGEFLEHKKLCITASVDNASHTGDMHHPASVQATVLDADGKSTTFIIINAADVDDKVSLSDKFVDVDATVNQLHNPPSSQQTVEMEMISSESGILFQ